MNRWRGIVLLLGVSGMGVAEAGGQHVWQSDLQIKSLTVSESHGNLTARFVVFAEIGEAMAAKVEIMLPPGVGIVEMGAGCQAGANPPGVSALRARVLCTLGNLPARASRELYVVTTRPPGKSSTEFGVIALSDTPDPRPGNNFAQRGMP
jgi:hypothetical protein